VGFLADSTGGSNMEIIGIVLFLMVVVPLAWMAIGIFKDEFWDKM
jgi:hypothetical protein